MRQKQRKNRSGLLPQSYQALSAEEKEQVKAAFLAYNQAHSQNPYFEIEDYYHRVYRVGGWFA